jgi:hypothetical protein
MPGTVLLRQQAGCPMQLTQKQRQDLQARFQLAKHENIAREREVLELKQRKAQRGDKRPVNVGIELEKHADYQGRMFRRCVQLGPQILQLFLDDATKRDGKVDELVYREALDKAVASTIFIVHVGVKFWRARS